MYRQPRKVGRIARALFRKQNGKCHYCDVQMVLRKGQSVTVTVDHKYPKSKGGTKHKNNIVGACWACNNAKGNMPYEDYLRVVAKRGRPDLKPNDFPDTIKTARAAKAKPIMAGAAPWKQKKMAARPYLETVGKGTSLADAFAAAGLKREDS